MAFRFDVSVSSFAIGVEAGAAYGQLEQPVGLRRRAFGAMFLLVCVLRRLPLRCLSRQFQQSLGCAARIQPVRHVVSKRRVFRSQRQDAEFKRDLYARLGVREYWLFDPTGDWLDPRLQGNGLFDGRFERLTPAGIEAGERVFHSAVLGLEIYVDRGEIRFRDPATGRKLLTLEETDRAWREGRRAQEEAQQAREEARLALEEAKRAREEVTRVREEARRERDALKLALEEARARIAELEGEPPAERSPPPRRR